MFKSPRSLTQRPFVKLGLLAAVSIAYALPAQADRWVWETTYQSGPACTDGVSGSKPCHERCADRYGSRHSGSSCTAEMYTFMWYYCSCRVKDDNVDDGGGIIQE